MIEAIKGFFMGKSTHEYAGLSDFLLRASPKEKREVITEAARRANKDQFEVFTKARLKVKMN